MKRGWILVALLVSLGVNLGLFGTAWMRRDGETWRERRAGEARLPVEEPGRRFAMRLGLDPDQSEQFIGIQRRLIERTAEGRQRTIVMRRELRRELRAPEPDRSRIDASLEALAMEDAALNRAFAESVLQSRAVLSPRQVENYLRFLEQFAPGRPGAGARGRERGREAPPGRRPRGDIP